MQLEKFINDLKTPSNTAFLEGIVMNGLKSCFEDATSTMEEIPVRAMGRVFFYDKAEQQYYEPAKDMFIPNEEFAILKADDDAAQIQYVRRIKKAIAQSSDSRELNELMQAKHLYWDQDKARDAEAKAMVITGDSSINESEGDELIQVDTDELSSEEIDVVQSQLGDIQTDKQELEVKEDELRRTTQAMSVNEV